jgi:flavoprotein
VYYEEAVNKTSKPHAPWYVVPADSKETARYIVAKAILEELQKHKDITQPAVDEKILANISMYKDMLLNE